MRVLIVVALLFTVVSAVPRPRQGRCEAPRQWEGAFLAYDMGTRYYARGRLAYDAEGKQVRMVEEVEENSTRSAHDDLYLFEKKVHYRVDIKTKKCSKVAIEEAFVPIEIHANSTFRGEVILGSLIAPASGVIVQNWSHKTENGEGYQIFTSIGCVPVEVLYLGEHGGARIHYHRQYYDIVPGIKDHSIFEIPKECM